jgi:hypothetical protein
MVHGLIGWSVGENLQAGLVRVERATPRNARVRPEERAASRLLVYQCLPSRYGFNVDDLR